MSMPWLELWAKIQVISTIVAWCIGGIAVAYYLIKLAVELSKLRRRKP